MKKIIIALVGFIILLSQSAFSQYDSIVVSGTCIDTSGSGGIGHYAGDANGKPTYQLSCSQFSSQTPCDAALTSHSTYTVTWTGSRWEYTASLDGCLWLVQICVPNSDGPPQTTLYMVNYENTPLPPAFGWQITDPNGCIPDLLGGYTCNIHEQTVKGDTTICTAFSPIISVDSTQERLNYYLRDNSNNAIVDGPVAGTGSAISFSAGTVVGNHTYHIYASSIHDSIHCHLILADSVIIKGLIQTNTTSSICSGDSVVVGTSVYKVTGNYADTLTSIQGCDSIIKLNLTVKPITASNPVLTICAGDSVMVGSHTYKTSGVYQDVFASANGCDSTVTTNLTVETAVDTTINVSGATISSNAAGATYQWIDCNNGNQPILGETNQTYTATVNGDYAVVITKNSCSDTSACVSIVSTALKDIASVNPNISVYPNPSSGIFNVKGLSKGIKIEIYNTLGVMIKILNTEAAELEIDMSAEANGIYLLRTSDHQVVRLNKHN